MNNIDTEKSDLITDTCSKNNETSKLQLPLQKNSLQNKKDDSFAAANTLSLQEDFDKIEKLSMINANARYELISANQQLIDFQMNRYIKHTKESRKLKIASQQQREASLNNNNTSKGTAQDSFELPEIPNITKADRVKSG